MSAIGVKSRGERAERRRPARRVVETGADQRRFGAQRARFGVAAMPP